MSVRIIPSIASADPLALREEMLRLGNYPYLHVDIEDYTFLPCITFGLKTAKAIASFTKAELDAHLMHTFSDEFIKPLQSFGFKRVCVHVESSNFPNRTINYIKAAGMEVGLALAMKTPVEYLLPYCDKINYALLLSSEPDGEEQCNPYALEKLKHMRNLLPPETGLWIDGGITKELLPAVVECGADTVIMGRAVWQAEDPVSAIREMQAR